MDVLTVTKSGNKATTAAKLDKKIFGLKVESADLLKQAYLTYLANGRVNLAKTKRRGEVQGGGSKPWRQKGTGRARFGSSRNPLWRGGGVVFGPLGVENYSLKIKTKSKKLALRQALSLAAANGKIIIIESIDIKDGKTKSAANFLNKVNAKSKVVIVNETKRPELIRPFNNLPGVKVISAKYLTVFDVLNADKLIISSGSLEEITSWLGGKQ
jgi:large subunit ribosomal protein L4